MGRYTVHLVGEANFHDVVSRLASGMAAKLVPEPTNEHDPRAIKAITASGETIGYVEKESWLTRAMLDDHTPVASRIMEIIGGDAAKPSRGVVLEVLTGPEATAALGRSAVVSAATSAASNGNTRMPTWAIVALVSVGVVIVASISASPPASNKPVPAAATEAATSALPSTNASNAGPVASEGASEPSKWSYSTDEDKVRGGASYYATTTSTNSIAQPFPYDSSTTMTITVRKSPAHGTDVVLTVSSGQLMCPSYEGCTGTASFDGGPAQRISFAGPADNSSDTIFIEGAQSFIAKLKKAKHVVIEKTMYQAGNPQFEFDVAGLKWEH